MSVIENALKKLQAQAAARPGTGPASAQSSYGRVLPEGPRGREGAGPALPPARTVAIDQRALRVAGLLPPEHQERALAREYQRIKRPIIAAATGRGGEAAPNGNLVMVASAMSGDGKTFMSLNLAFSMRLESDLNIVLVDGDVLRAQISKLLGIGSEPGLLDALRDPTVDVESLVLPTDVPGLSVLPAGRNPQNATELLSSSRMQDVLKRLGAHSPHRIVLFDSPPLLITTESQALGHVLGQIVLVVRADHTPQHAVLEAIELLGENKRISLVLNQSLRTPPSDYYQYYNNNESNDSMPSR